MKTILVLSILFLVIALPALGELADAELNQIRLIVKKEVKTEVTNAEKRINENTNVKIDSLKTPVVWLIGILVALIALIGIPLVVLTIITNRIFVPYWHYCTLCVFLILLGIFGCGEADDTSTSGADEDSSKNLVGTWELITIDGKTPKADFENNLKHEDTEVLAAASKIVLASDGALFQDRSLTIRTLIQAPPKIYVRSRVLQTVEGRYVVSGSTIELIRSGDDVRFTTHTSWETPGNPKLKQQLEQDPDSEEFRQGFEAGLKDELQKNVDNWALQLSTNTFFLEDNRLTLINGNTSVYKKR